MTERHLVELLAARGVDLQTTPVYLMRHADKRYPDLERYVGTRELTVYQGIQRRPHPAGSLVVGFLGVRPGYGLLLGVWRVKECLKMAEAQARGLLEGSFVRGEDQRLPYFLEMSETGLLADLRMRLEIEWGAERVWRRVLAAGQVYPISLREGGRAA